MADQLKTASNIDLVPLLVVILIVGHVLALVYWLYRVATERQPQRRKKH